MTAGLVTPPGHFSRCDYRMMAHAMEAAHEAASFGEVPVGAVIAYNGYVVARAGNRREMLQQVSAHAEMLAICEASKLLGTWRLDACDLYVTLEPCAMCAGAIQQARVRRVIFGARDPKAGVLISTDRYFMRPGLNHYPAVQEGLLAPAASSLLKDFFRVLRAR